MTTAAACGPNHQFKNQTEGKATKEAARHLKVGVKTAETHRRNIMEKLGIHSVAELTKYAIREGLTTAEP